MPCPSYPDIMKKKNILFIIVLAIAFFIIFSLIFRNWEALKGLFL
jgi:hypothetical protein